MSDLVPEMLSASLDDELSSADRSRVEAQLTESADWRAELEEVRAARDAVRGLPLRDAPDGFWDAVHAELELTEVIPITAASTRRRRPVVWMAAGVAAAAAVVAVIVIPHRSQVAPNVAAVVAQHGAQSSDTSDPVSALAPVGPLAGFRR